MFDAFTGKPKDGGVTQKIHNPEDRSRQEELLRSLLNTPQGKELVSIWERMLVNSPCFNGGDNLALLNLNLGVNKCIQNFVKIAKSKPKPKKKDTKK